MENIKKDRNMLEKIGQKKKRTWLKFSIPIPSDLHKPISQKLKRDGEIIKWLSDDEIEIKLW